MGINKQNRGQGADPAFPRLLGERLCLDYVNTVESPRADSVEYLHSYADLARWGRHVGILSDGECDDLLSKSARQPSTAEAVFEQAMALRATLNRIFRALANGQAAAEADLHDVQTAYVEAFAQARLTATGDGYVWVWDADNALERPLWAVTRSAVEVLTTDDLTRVKECPGAGDCGWLFYDTSKNNSRHWCSMEGCGSRVKMRRQYARQRAE